MNIIFLPIFLLQAFVFAEEASQAPVAGEVVKNAEGCGCPLPPMPRRPCHREHHCTSSSSSSSSCSSEWPTWYPTVESSSSTTCHKPRPCNTCHKPRPCQCHKPSPCNTCHQPRPCPCPRPLKPCHRRSSSSSSCSSSSSSSSLPSCKPNPFVQDFTYSFDAACKTGATMTVRRKHHACRRADLIIKDGCKEIYNSKEHKCSVKLSEGKHRVTMTMISKQQHKIHGTTVNTQCPEGTLGVCWNFELFLVCFCS